MFKSHPLKRFMWDAEAIAERIVCLGGEPTTQPDPITLGRTARDILSTNTEAEHGAIVLYEHIIQVVKRERDDIIMKLFMNILSDEKNHLNRFSTLLKEEL